MEPKPIVSAVPFQIINENENENKGIQLRCDTGQWENQYTQKEEIRENNDQNDNFQPGTENPRLYQGKDTLAVLPNTPSLLDNEMIEE